MCHRKTIRAFTLASSFSLLLALPLSATSRLRAAADRSPGDDSLISCEMTFSLRSWSAVYRSGRGTGTIRCDNGQTSRVKIRTWSAGITAGKSEVLEGIAQFSLAKDISELYGSYAHAEAHAGAVRSADAQAMTKGEISMAMAGTGRGVELGFSFGKVKIKPLRD